MVWEGLRSGPKMKIQLNFRTAALVTLAPGGAVNHLRSTLYNIVQWFDQ